MEIEPSVVSHWWPYILNFCQHKREYLVVDASGRSETRSFGNHFYSEEDAVRYMERKLNES